MKTIEIGTDLNNASLWLTTPCPYIHDDRMVGSLTCTYCKYNDDIDIENMIIKCSYEDDNKEE